MSPFSFLGESGVNFSFLMKIILTNRKVPAGMPRFAASHLGLFCWHISHKKDARLIWVKSKEIRQQNMICKISKNLTSNCILLKIQSLKVQMRRLMMSTVSANSAIGVFGASRVNLLTRCCIQGSLKSA